jgi:TatD DNase family protein
MSVSVSDFDNWYQYTTNRLFVNPLGPDMVTFPHCRPFIACRVTEQRPTIACRIHRSYARTFSHTSARVTMRTVLIDTHTHLDDTRYNDDLEAVVARAREAGVEAFVTIGCDLTTSQAAVALADHYPFVYASVGVHPHEVKHIQDGWYDEFRRLAKRNNVVAFGEIGLDYHYNHSPPKEQRERFREQIQLARELKLPVIIHTREAQEDTISILREEKASDIGGVFHCFSGDAWLAKDALDLGFSLSFSGILTFQNATMLHEIARNTPLDRLLIETDCPYLTPVPYRGKRNEPAYVSQVAKQLASLHNMSLDEVAGRTSDNAKKLFKIV